VIISCVERLMQIADEVQKELLAEGDAGLVGSQPGSPRFRTDSARR
jgi:hypothetical protein